MIIPHRLAATAFILLFFTGIAQPTAAAHAGSPASAIQQQISAHLRAHPGGKQISLTEIAYADGAFVITFAQSSTVSPMSGADCPSGWFCFYDNLNYGYPRGKLSSCGWQDLAVWGWNDRTESVFNAQPGGRVIFLDHQGGSSHISDKWLFDLYAGQGDNDVSPYLNIADHVNRIC